MDYRITYKYDRLKKDVKTQDCPDEKIYSIRQSLCKTFLSFDYSADSSEVESFFFRDFPEIIL